jgi:alpha-tubulin suppressor-like RCC1 family protein
MADVCVDHVLRHCEEGSWQQTPCDPPVCSEGRCVSVKQLTVGHNHSCALLDDGSVRCWGANNHQQLGSPAANHPTLAPTPVLGLPPVETIEAGAWVNCAQTNGLVRCWGLSSNGGVGDGIANAHVVSSAVMVIDEQGLAIEAAHQATGWNHACAVLAAGPIVCWGTNEAGELGDGTLMNRAVATPVVW